MPKYRPIRRQPRVRKRTSSITDARAKANKRPQTEAKRVNSQIDRHLAILDVKAGIFKTLKDAINYRKKTYNIDGELYNMQNRTINAGRSLARAKNLLKYNKIRRLNIQIKKARNSILAYFNGKINSYEMDRILKSYPFTKKL